MNIKKIIQEEVNEFEWTDDIGAIPKDRFCVTFCDYDITEDDGDIIKKVILKLEGHFNRVYPDVFDSSNIHNSLLMNGVNNSGFMIYVTPQEKDGKDVGHIGWDDCISYDDSYDITYTHEEFMNL